MGSTYQSIVIDAPADAVWNAICDFHDLSWAPNVVNQVEAPGDRNGDEVGAQRVLNNAFHETLLELDDNDRSLAYSIDDGPSPVSKNDVSQYVSRVKVRPVTEEGKSFVEWSSAWEGGEQEAAEEFCHGIYVALLKDMKKTLES